MKLAVYQRNTKKLQVFVIAVPVLSKLFDQHSGIPFPPMGDETALSRFFAVLVIGAAAAVPYVLPIKRVSHWVVVGLFCALVLSSLFYLKLEQDFVVTIHLPASEGHPDGAKAFVTRGQRRPDLKQPYASMEDDDLIMSTGLTDERLERVYTKQSLATNRLQLLCAYVFPLACLEMFLGVIAKTDT